MIWVNRYMTHFADPKMSWGYGVSPLVLDDSVLFPWNHHKGPCFLLGLDKKTGAFCLSTRTSGLLVFIFTWVLLFTLGVTYLNY